MIKLDCGGVLCEVAQPGGECKQIVWNHFSRHQRERIVRQARVEASHEGPAHGRAEDQRLVHHRQPPELHQRLGRVRGERVHRHLGGRLQDAHAVPQQHRVEDHGSRQMRGQPVLRDPEISNNGGWQRRIWLFLTLEHRMGLQSFCDPDPT